jgi:AraC-like DNA-binding protein
MILYFFRYSALFYNDVLEFKTHRHHMMEIFIALEGKVKIKTEKNECAARYLIVDADIEHHVVTDTRYFVLLLGSESLFARRLRELYLGGKGICTLPDRMLAGLKTALHSATRPECGIKQARLLHDRLLGALLGKQKNPPPGIDPRIEKLIAELPSLPEKKIGIREMAEKVHLSESRLSHLFTKEIGVPVRPYLLWLKLLDALNLIISGTRFTEAAHEAGFSDSSHLSRTFKRMFGLKLLDVFKNPKDSRFVQVKIEKNPYL